MSYPTTSQSSNPKKHIVLGLAPAAGLFGKVRPQQDVVALIRYAVERGGIADLDTAPWYGCGKSEMDVGAALLDLQDHPLGTHDHTDHTPSSSSSSIQEKLLDALIIKNNGSKDEGGASSLSGVHFVDSSLFWQSEEGGAKNITPTTKQNECNPKAEVFSSDSSPPLSPVVDDDHGKYLTVPHNLRISTKIGRVLVHRSTSIGTTGVLVQQYHPDPSFCSVPVSQPSLEQYRSRLQSRFNEYNTADIKHRAKLQQEADVTKRGSSPQFPTCASLYYPHPETDDFVCVNDYTYSGVLNSFSQSYQRLYGPLHQNRNETITINEHGFIQISKNLVEEKCSAGDGGWYVTDTLRLHDADTEEYFKEVTTEGGLIAMRVLQLLGYITHLGLGLNCAKFTKRYVDFGETLSIIYQGGRSTSASSLITSPTDPNTAQATGSCYVKGTSGGGGGILSPTTANASSLPFFNSMLLAGCWNLVDRSAQEHFSPPPSTITSPTYQPQPPESALGGLATYPAVQQHANNNVIITSPTSMSTSSVVSSTASCSSVATTTTKLFNAGIFASGLLWGGSTFRYFPASPEIQRKRDAYNTAARRRFIPLHKEPSLTTTTSSKYCEEVGVVDSILDLAAQVVSVTPYLPLAALSCTFARVSPSMSEFGETGLPREGEEEGSSSVVVGCASIEELQGTLLALLLAPSESVLAAIEKEVRVGS